MPALHTQDRVLMMSITMENPAFMVVGFFVFAVATLGVLMVMESLSAFLHALRLHLRLQPSKVHPLRTNWPGCLLLSTQCIHTPLQECWMSLEL